MKIDSFMPFYGNDFFQAMAGRDETVICGYMKALWHYWHHTHCEGLDDDDDFLRRLCGVDPTKWARTKGVIFDGEKFFVKQDGKWHQLRAKDEHDERLTAYRKKADAMNKARKSLEASPVDCPDNSPDNSINKQSARQSGSGSYSYSSTGGEGVGEDARELPPSDQKRVAALLRLAQSLFGLPPLDVNTERIRGNLSELQATGYKDEQVESVLRWATSEKARHKAGRPQSAVSATDPSKFSQWLQTKQNHAAELEAEAKKRNR